ncbi:hypothetical protein CDEST_14305 [Colletotrichum destructivum]|uniref:Uncharacterized protein n=1 Tax=Colletotrichum destructivum TaxID=34406 RepID=A0AAX4J1C0_9PEZI|nr:hypothetical protein CDEST_14305 [Colletotrichum destructivum]
MRLYQTLSFSERFDLKISGRDWLSSSMAVSAVDWDWPAAVLRETPAVMGALWPDCGAAADMKSLSTFSSSCALS